MNRGRAPSSRHRIAALLAICCLGLALVAIAFAVIHGDVWRIPVLLLAVGATVIGLWYALSRRGPGGGIGAVTAIIGILAVLLVVLTADYRGVPFALAIALIIGSAAAARYALHHERHLPGSTGATVAPTPSPQHPVLIMNPKSGGGKVERFHLVEECRARGVEPIVLGPGDDLLKVAEEAIERGADVIGMAGGDGSQALVATIASAHDIPHVCVPAGTRNHFALDLGIDRDDVVGALDAFVDGVERRLDLARVNGRVFVNNACAGLYAKIVQSAAYRDAKLKTVVAMLPDMLGPDAEPFDLRFTGPDGVDYPTAHLVLVSNNPYELDHLAGRGSRERIDLGTLGVVAARIAGPSEAVTFVSLEAAGRIRSFRGWLEWNTPRFVVDSSAPVEIAIDGEALLMDPPLVFECQAGALRVRIPKKATGVAPAAAAVHLSTRTLTDLFSIAAGQWKDLS